MRLDLYIGEEHITSLLELGQKMYLYPDQTYSFVIREDFAKMLRLEEPILHVKFMELLKIEDDHIFLFKVSYLFCPYMTFRYNKHNFAELRELGEKIIGFGPQIDVYLMDILEHKLLSYFLELQEKNTSQRKLYQMVIEIEEQYKTNPHLAYFTLGFKLSEFKAIIYKGKPYLTPKLFFEFITNNTNITEFAMSFEKDQYVFAWLSSLGFNNVLERYHNLVDLITAKEKN